MNYLIVTLFLLLIVQPSLAEQDLFLEYILSGKPFEIKFGNYGFVGREWIGRCDPTTSNILCGKTYKGRYNPYTQSWEFKRFKEDTRKIEVHTSKAITKGNPINYKFRVWDEEFRFDQEGRVFHPVDGKVATISPIDNAKTLLTTTKPLPIKKKASDFRNEGYDFIQKGEYQNALRSLNKAIKLNRMDSDSYYYRGYTLMRLKDYNNAIMDLEKATILDPSFATAYSSLAISYVELKDYDHAIRSATKALNLDPKDATSYYNRGIAYYYLGEYKNAYRDFDEVVKLEPTNQDAKTNRDILLKKIGEQ